MNNNLENENSESLSSIEKAKILLGREKGVARTKEEIEQQEENMRLASLFSRYTNIVEELAKVRTEKGEHADKFALFAQKKNNLSSAERQALEMLKFDKDTSYLFEKDKGEDSELRAKRRELFEVVVGEAQDEKREIKRDKKQEDQDFNTAVDAEKRLIAQLEELRKTPDWVKLEEQKKKQVYETRKKFDDFYKDQVKSEKSHLASKIEKVNAFSEKHKDSIDALKTELRKALEGLVENEHAVFTNAQKSQEYQPKVFGEIDFAKYTKLLPKDIDELQFSIYSSDQGSLTFPQLDYNSPVYKELQSDIGLVSGEIRAVQEKIRNARGLFSGKKEMEKTQEKLQSKYQFLTKIRDSIGVHLQKFNEIEPSEAAFGISSESRERYYAKIGYTVGRFVNAISSDMYPLDEKESTFPEFKRTTNINDLFRWAKQNEIPIEYQDARKEYEKLKTVAEQTLQVYRLVAGDDAVNRLRYI